MKIKWCNRTMFLGPPYCLVTTPKMFREELKRLGIKDSLDYMANSSSDATCYEFENKGKTSLIVTLKGWEDADPIDVASLLVHEATHIKQHVMRIIGEKNPSSEFEAYMMQNIAGNLMQAFVEQTQ